MILIKRFLLLTIFALSSCNYVQEFSEPDVTTLSIPEYTHSRSVAILPFRNLTDNENISVVLRNEVYSNLSLKDYDLVRLKHIDQKLQLASYDTSDIYEIGHYQLGKILNADILLYCTVTKCSKLFGVVYSRITIDAEMEMVDASNSETIWKASHAELTHAGSIPISPFSIPEKIVDSAMNIRDKVIKETADRLAKKFVKSMPEFSVDEDLREYAIVIKNVGNKNEVYYKVQQNDTLFKIAKRFYGKGTRWRDIKFANNEIESASLKVGRELRLPDVPVLKDLSDVKLLDRSHYKKAVYKVKWGDSLYKIAYALYQDGDKWHVIHEDNKSEIEDIKDLNVGQVLVLPLIYDGPIVLRR